MSGYLLDTNVVLIAETSPDELSPRVRRAIARGPAFLSVISYWEVVIKAGKGKLELGDPRVWWTATLEDLALTPLPFRPEHVGEIAGLAAHHSDPFDRALIAQAIAENLILLTTDSAIGSYASKRFRFLD